MATPLTAGPDSSDPVGSTSGMLSTVRSMFDEAVVSVTFPGNVIAADGAEANGTTATAVIRNRRLRWGWPVPWSERWVEWVPR